MSYAHIEVKRDDHIAWLHFNRPDKANALNYEHLSEIEDAALSFRDDADTRVVVWEFAGRGGTDAFADKHRDHCI